MSLSNQIIGLATRIGQEIKLLMRKSANLSDVANRQTALNNLTGSGSATGEYVLTKDTASGNVLFKQAPGANISYGIANNNAVKVSVADVASGEYAKFNGTGLESKTPAELLSDIGGATAGHNHSGAYEAVIIKGNTAQYFRGDMSLANMPTSLPASDVYAWAKAATKPSYTAVEIGSDSAGTARPASDVYAWAKAATKPGYSAAEVGAAASGHGHDYATHRGEGTNYVDYCYGMYDAYIGGWRASNDLRVLYAQTAGSAAANDVYGWAKAATKPSYTAAEVGSDAAGTARPASGGNADTLDGYHVTELALKNNAASGQGVAYAGQGGTDFQGVGAGAAMISFHRPGAYALNFGLDTDNILKVGGWSMGAVSHAIMHAGNIGSQSVNYAASSGYAASAGSAPANDVYAWAKQPTPPASGTFTPSVIGGNTTAVKNTLYVLTSSLTLTLPASPSAGDSVKISNLSGVLTCSIARNGSTIMGLSEDLTLDKANAGFEMIFTNATYGWVII